MSPALLEALDRLERARLTDARWAAVSDLVARCAALLVDGDEPALEAAVRELSLESFHAQVHHRLGGDRRGAPVVVPAKRTPVLPIVGAICAVGIGALGWAIGGGIVAAGTVLLAVFVLGVALAGTRAADERRLPQPRAEPADPLRPASAGERALLDGLRARLDLPDPGSP